MLLVNVDLHRCHPSKSTLPVTQLRFHFIFQRFCLAALCLIDCEMKKQTHLCYEWYTALFQSWKCLAGYNGWSQRVSCFQIFSPSIALVKDAMAETVTQHFSEESYQHHAPWRKLLWVKQSYPDNYVDSTFLEELQKNGELAISLPNQVFIP